MTDRLFDFLTNDGISAEMQLSKERSPHALDVNGLGVSRSGAPADSSIPVTPEEEEAWVRMGALE